MTRAGASGVDTDSPAHFRVRDAAAIALIAAVVASPSLLGPINAYDGGLAGSAGTFLLHGQLPYRDFWWLYGPLTPIVTALSTFLFGPSILVLRLLGLAALMAQAGLGYALLRTRIGHLWAAIIAIASVSMGAVILGIEISAWSLSLTLALASLAARCLAPSRPWVAGVLAGCAFLARFDVGGYALLGCLALPNRRSVLAGFVAIAAPAVVVLALTAPFDSLFEQIIWFPIVGQRQFRGVPAPQIADAVTALVYLPIGLIPKVAIVAAAIRLALVRVRPPAFVVLTVFATLCQLQTQGRADIGHQAQAAVPGFLLLGIWTMAATGGHDRARPLPAGLRVRRLAGRALVGIACALALVIGSLSIWAVRSGPLDAADATLVAGIRTVAANTSPDEPIFVGLTSHRFTSFNPMLAYYLADRRAGVRVAMFNPGITNTDPVQREMIEDLLDSDTEVLLLDAEFALHSEAANDSRIPGSRLLDDYISANFMTVCTFGDTHILATMARASSITCVGPTDERLVSVLAGIRPGR